MVETLKNYIAGKWTESTSGKTFENENPSKRGEILNCAQSSTSEEMRQAIDKASEVFPMWRNTPVETRQKLVGEFLKLLADSRDELAAAVTRENGKTIRESHSEIDSALLEGEYHHRQISTFSGHVAISNKFGVAWEQYHPLGVVGIISPWNYPVNVMCRKTLPALLTGNTVVFKPASFTPWSATIMARLFESAGFPPGVFNCITGMGSSVGNAIIKDRRIRAVSFTGSTSVGRKIQALAAENLTRTQLELGGKNALIVMDDANLDEAVQAAVAAGFGCSGQWCTSTSRILLHRDISVKFIEKLVQVANGMKVGDPLDRSTDMGPVAGPDQFENISTAIAKAEKDGAKLLCGGVLKPDIGGYFIRPTVFDDVTPSMEIFREEIFGPVLGITKFTCLDEAIDLANKSAYGLSSAIFTGNIKSAQKYIDLMDAGMAHVNIHTGFKTPEMPFGGWKESGFGQPENSRTGLDFFVDRKAVYLRGI